MSAAMSDYLDEIERLRADKDVISSTASGYLHEIEWLRDEVASLKLLVKTMVDAMASREAGHD